MVYLHKLIQIYNKNYIIWGVMGAVKRVVERAVREARIPALTHVDKAKPFFFFTDF